MQARQISVALLVVTGALVAAAFSDDPQRRYLTPGLVQAADEAEAERPEPHPKRLRVAGLGTISKVERITLDGGKVEVLNGASLISAGDSSGTRLASGSARGLVEGPGSVWIAKGNLEIGDAGSAQLVVRDGGTLISGGTQNNRSRVSGGGSVHDVSRVLVTGEGSSWTITGDFEIGDSGEAHLVIADGGKVISGLGGDRSRVSGAGGPKEDKSTATVTGAKSRWVINGDFEIGDSGGASLSVLDGGVVTSGIGGRTRLVGAGGEESTATIRGEGSAWVVHSTLQLGDFGHVILEVADGGIVSTAEDLGNPATIRLAKGIVRAPNVLNRGKIEGDGTIDGNLINGGQLVPGDGEIKVQGTCKHAGTLAVRLKSLGAPVLVVQGEAELAGTLTVETNDGVVPDKGDTFDVVSFKSVKGRFATVNLPPLESGLSWDVSYGETAVRLHVVATNKK